MTFVACTEGTLPLGVEPRLKMQLAVWNEQNHYPT